MAKLHLLSLPTEILQSIYLHSLSPHLPQASPILASALSTDHIYRLTFLHAFWNNFPLVFGGTTGHKAYDDLITGKITPKAYYEPGPRVRSLFHPLSVPLPSVVTEDGQTREELQEIVLRLRWCTFNNAKRYVEDITQAVIKDLLCTLDLPISSDDQTRLNHFVANLPASHATLKVTALNVGGSIELIYPRPFATALLANYHGLDTRFDETVSPNLTIAPTKFLIIPSHVIAEKSEWTEEKLNMLKMLASYINLHKVKYQLEAFYKGMETAIVRGHYDALLTLVWLATRLAEYKDVVSGNENPFEPPGELFRLVARRSIQNIEAVSDGHSNSEAGRIDAPSSIRLFPLLLRAHAESMPQDDPDIIAWADQLLTCPESSKSDQAFANWVLDWSKKKRLSEYTTLQVRFRRRGEGQVIRRPMFSGGNVSRFREAEKIARRFVEISGGRIGSFSDEVERGWEWGRAGVVERRE